MLTQLKEALTTLTPKTNVYHFVALRATAPYIVYAEDGANDLEADGKHAEKCDEGTIDLYTKTEDDPRFAAIESALESIDCAWYYNSTQYESETGLIHHEWVFQVV